MSRAKEYRLAQKQPLLRYVPNELIIKLLNSWVIQNFQANPPDTLPPEKYLLQKKFEDEMRIAMCIAKHKPELSAKPKHPHRPYKGFFEFINKMRTVTIERGITYKFGRKLYDGYKVEMIDGIYKVKNLTVDPETNYGSLDLVKGDLAYHVQWTNNNPRFYYLKDNAPEWKAPVDHPEYKRIKEVNNDTSNVAKLLSKNHPNMIYKNQVGGSSKVYYKETPLPGSPEDVIRVNTNLRNNDKTILDALKEELDKNGVIGPRAFDRICKKYDGGRTE